MTTKSSKICISKKFLILGIFFFFIIGAAIISNYVNSFKLSQNSRAKERRTNRFLPKSQQSQINWEFEPAFCGDCLSGKRTPSLPPPGRVKIIKNNRPYEVIVPVDPQFPVYNLDFNDDPNIQRVSLEGTTDTTFSIHDKVEWQYCNGGSNPLSPLGTYWMTRKSISCPLITDPTPTPEILPDLIIYSLITSATDDPSEFTIKITVKNVGKITAENIYGQNIYLRGYVDPIEYPPTIQTPDTFSTSFPSLAPGVSFKYEKTLSLEKGSHQIYAWIDWNNAIPENNERTTLKNAMPS